MKKTLLVAASLFTTAAAVTMGEAVKATEILQVESAPSPQFVLSQISAGNLVFQGVGTAQYNNSIGTNNSFQVGSSTNLGVNASTSSTPEYGVNSHAKLDLSGNTTLKQVIGTSGSSHQTSAEQIAAMTLSHDTADSAANTYAETEAAKIETTSHEQLATETATNAQNSWQNTNSDTWSDYQTANSSDGVMNDDALYVTESAWNAANQESYDSAYEETYTASYNDAYSEAWQGFYEEQYATTYSDVYSEAASNIATNTESTATDGTIKGSFTTTESGSAASASTMSQWEDSAQSDAKAETIAAYGSSWSEYQDMNQVDDGSGGTVFDTDAAVQSAEAWQDAYSSSYSTAFNNSYSNTASGASRTSDSQVEVMGIGSDATVSSAATSTFDVEIKNNTGTSEAESTATASGSAGANLSTSSFANQSQATTASAFMQAFGGVLVEGEGG